MNESLELATEYRCLLAKLEELLRVYRVARKNDKNNALQERVRAKSTELIATLRTFPAFADVEDDYRAKIDYSFREPKPEPPQTKAPRENAEGQRAKQPEAPKKNAFSSASSYSNYSSSQSMQLSALTAPKKDAPEDKPKPPSLLDRKDKETPLPAKPAKLEPAFPKKVEETPKPPAATPKAESISDSISSSSRSSANEVKKESSSISTIQNQKFFEKEKSQTSQESFLGLLDENESDGDFNINLKLQKSEEKVETPPGSYSTPKEEEFDKLSEVSVVENPADTIANFCRANEERLNTELLFNEDIFDYLRDEEGDFIYLFGVNKPEGKKMQKLYACTVMKFSTAEVVKCDDLFDKEGRDFKNNIRTPVGLIIRGDNAAAIMPEHLKFLINLRCPYLTVLVLRDFQTLDGLLCYFDSNTVERIKFTPRKQLGQYAAELAKKTFALPFGEAFLPKEKTRYVITKSLNRTIATIAEEAPNAITISKSDCIREEKNPFSYKVHQKFFTSLKTEHTIYYVNNGIAQSRLSYKTFEAFKSEAITLQPKVPAIFSLTMTRDNVPVKKEFFEVLLQCAKNRDPNIFLNLSNMNAKKCIVVALKPEVTPEMLNALEPIPLKNFEKDTPITYCMLVITKNNIKDFEAQCEIEEIKAP